MCILVWRKRQLFLYNCEITPLLRSQPKGRRKGKRKSDFNRREHLRKLHPFWRWMRVDWSCSIGRTPYGETCADFMRENNIIVYMCQKQRSSIIARSAIGVCWKDKMQLSLVSSVLSQVAAAGYSQALSVVQWMFSVVRWLIWMCGCR